MVLLAEYCCNGNSIFRLSIDGKDCLIGLDSANLGGATVHRIDGRLKRNAAYGANSATRTIGELIRPAGTGMGGALEAAES